MICSLCLAYCIENNIEPNIAFGDYRISKCEERHFGYNWTDWYDLWIEFDTFLKKYVPSLNILIPFYHQNEAVELIVKDKNLIPLYQSCMLSLGYRTSLHNTNVKKYNIDLLPNRCGSCRKCCVEYIDLADRKILPYNKDFYKHFLQLAKIKVMNFLEEKRF